MTKTIVQTILFWGVFLYLIPRVILNIEKNLGIGTIAQYKTIGWVVFVLMSILGLISGFTMSRYGMGTPLPLDCPQKLVVRGPYRYVRNPMAIAGIGQAIGIGFILGSVSVTAYAIIGAILWHTVVRPIEEQDLSSYFGMEYTIYKSKVKCWIPKLSGT